MDRSEIDDLVQRLVDNPHDEEALAYAHQSGESDPKAYASLLERVGEASKDNAFAAHWLGEAANVWLTTLSDAHRAARLLMAAVAKDATASVPAERLAQLYRDKGDAKALVALLERRSKALSGIIAGQPELRGELAGMYEEMGRLWSEAPLSQPKKAIECFKKAMDTDPTSAYAIYNARELLKQQGAFKDALPLFAAELEIEQDPARRVGLLRDEAQTRKLAADLPGASRALAEARKLDSEDPTLSQEYAQSVLDRIQAGERVPDAERDDAAGTLIGLAESYQGEHGFAYAGAALDVSPGDERAIQLFSFYARELSQDTDLPARYSAYLAANPRGSMATEVRHSVAATHESAGQFQDAVNVLRPLADAGDAAATAKIQELSPMIASSAPQPTTMPSREPAGSGRDTARGSNAPGEAREVRELTVSKSEPNKIDPKKSAPPRHDSRQLDKPDVANALPDLDVEADPAPAPRRAQLSPDKLQGILDAAQMLVGKGKKPEAFAKYKEILDSNPAHAEALAWVEEYLRSKRDYAQLKEVLLGAVRASTSPETQESKKERLREIAGLCEANLRDVDAAISAWKQLLVLERRDESARGALMRLLERSQRWDELATLLEQEANIESDVEAKITLEKRLAKLHEDKRKDLVQAGEAWIRICMLTPDDAVAIHTAAKLFERGERLDLAAKFIADAAPNLEDPIAKGPLLQRLAELRELQSDLIGAGDAYAEAADSLKLGKLWEEADRLYVQAEQWQKAAQAATQRGQLTSDAKQKAHFLYKASEYLAKVGDQESSLEKLEEATKLDPVNDDYATALVGKYVAQEQHDKLVAYLTRRGDRLMDKSKRIAVRREAATIAQTRLTDRELAREMWLKVLEDGDDREALEKLIDDAIERSDHTEAATLLRRLGGNIVDKAEKARVALREAELLAEGVGDVDTAVARYEQILEELDATCRPALQAIADLQEARDNHGAAADALERELKLVADVQERGQIAARLARLYEVLKDPRSAIRALDLVRKADLEDFDALTRLCELCEITEQWGRVAELLVERIEIEADEAEVSVLTMKLARMLADKLDRGDEALAALTELADSGDAQVRAAYIELGDRLGWKGIVASKLVDWWFDAKQGPDRTSALRNAFDRFVDVGRDQDAVRVAIELVRTKGADRNLADQLEELAVKTGDHDALSIAHELLAKEVTGPDRAYELVRQAEVRVKSGMPRQDALQHGEAGMVSIAATDAEPLLDRLAQLATKPSEVVDLYERQVSRSKAPLDRVKALARAAQVAATRGAPDRARGFCELALAGAPTEETLGILELAAREGDRLAGGDKLRRALSSAMAAGGHGARDGGKTRGALLRRAAQIAHRDLNDVEQAFGWLADALVSHVDGQTLDSLEALGLEIADPRRAEGAITHALNEVFDGPLVRQLLGRRAKIRRDQIVDHQGAAQDLKKLHDLSPNDGAVMEELAGLLTDLADFKTLVQVYEDQILRGKDVNIRAELARKVARMWEEQLTDAREAADGWRRVLRMKAGDTEATAGLERAKTNALKKPDPGTLREAYAPPKMEPKVEPPPPKAPSPVAPAPSPSGATLSSISGSIAAAVPPVRPSSPGRTSAPPLEPRPNGSGSGPPQRRPPSMSPPGKMAQRPLTPRVPSEPPPATAKPRSEPPPLPPEARIPSAPPVLPHEMTGADHEDLTRPPVFSRPPLRTDPPANSPADDEPNTAMTQTGAGAAAANAGGALEMEIDASLGRLELGGESDASAGAPKTLEHDRLKRDSADTMALDRPAHFEEGLGAPSASAPHTLPGMPVDAASFNIPPAEPSREEVELDEVDLLDGDHMDATQARPQTKGETAALEDEIEIDDDPRPVDEEHTETSQTVRPVRSPS